MFKIYYYFAIAYTFIIWGFWYGILSILVPIFPMIDLIKFLIN